MPLFDIPVVIPFRLEGDTSDTLYPVHVRTVASGMNPALATAEVLAATLGRLRYPGRKVVVERQRAKIGSPTRQVEGPYAYVFGRGGYIHHIDLPARIENNFGEALGKLFSSCDKHNAFGVVVDCAPLTYINSSGLAAFAANSRMLILFRLPPSITKVFELVGLNRMLRILPSLTTALAELEKNSTPTLEVVDR